MKTLFAWVVFGGLLSLPLMAQDNPKLEVFGGYQYLRIGLYSATPFNAGAFNGWNAAAAANLSKYFGVEGDFGGSYNYLTISRSDCYRVERSGSRAGLHSRCGPVPFHGAPTSFDSVHI